MVQRVGAAIAAIFLLSALCLPAQAATFDFVAAAAGNERGAASFVFTEGGITLSATAYLLSNGNATNPYLDDLSGGPGGLGVCQNLTASFQCNPSSDDNITINEVLVLTFDREVTISNITFSNGDHQDLYTGNFGVAIDPMSAPTMVSDFDTSNAAAAQFNGSLTGTTFYFISPATVDNVNEVRRQIYVSSVTATSVPEPATVGLFSLGLGLLWGARRLSRSFTG